MDLVRSIPESTGDLAYDKGKWTIKEVIQHLIDSERIFSYRALRFARMDKTDLPGFEQNDYVPASKASNRSLASLMNEFKSVRNATIDLFKSLNNEMLKSIGTANGFPFSAEAVGYITAGHCFHHADIIRERYLNAD